MVGWMTTYPFDVIKSYMQYHNENSSLFSIARHIYKKKGFYYFYRGIGVTMLRAFPVNAVAF
jgi:mitochondrial ornithine carrier protein